MEFCLDSSQTTTHETDNAPSAVILAAGKGTRMKSDLPKVLHEVADRPMVCHVVDACIKAGCGTIVVVVGYKRELVEAALGNYPQVRFAVQDQQLGTGHAVVCAQLELADTIAAKRDTFVLCGDGPLIRPGTLKTMLDRHRSTGAVATLATSIIDDPTGYGRIVRSLDGTFRAIVEQKHLNEDQFAIREVNPSYYCFNPREIFVALDRVQRNDVSGEYYLTDTLELLKNDGKRVEVIDAVPPEDVLSINTLDQLALVDKALRARVSSSRTHTPSCCGGNA